MVGLAACTPQLQQTALPTKDAETPSNTIQTVENEIRRIINSEDKQCKLDGYTVIVQTGRISVGSFSSLFSDMLKKSSGGDSKFANIKDIVQLQGIITGYKWNERNSFWVYHNGELVANYYCDGEDVIKTDTQETQLLKFYNEPEKLAQHVGFDGTIEKMLLISDQDDSYGKFIVMDTDRGRYVYWKINSNRIKPMPQEERYYEYFVPMQAYTEFADEFKKQDFYLGGESPVEVDTLALIEQYAINE